MSATASSSSSSSFSSTSSSGTASTEFLPKVDGRTDTFRMVHANGSSCEVNLLGATITSWKLLGQEMLFVSDKAIYAPGKAIRGGIPVVFPQFGPGKLPQHGFARNQIWTHEHVNINKATGEVHATFSLSENEETLKVWPYKFQLQLLIILKASSLSMQLRVTNTGTSSFDFTTLLHTYFHVADISGATVAGLNGKQYIDKVNGGNIREEKDQVIRFNGEVDRVYIKGAADGNSVYIGDGGNCDVMVKATGFTDFVVWNPWIEKSKGMADMQTDGYHHFVCVEAGCVVDPITLEAGATWEGAQGFSLRVLGK